MIFYYIHPMSQKVTGLIGNLNRF